MDMIDLKLMTEDELMALGSDARVEIIEGELIEMSPVGMLHHIIAGNIYDILKPFVVANKLGYVFMDGLICILETVGSGIRGAQVPDVCFVRRGRIPPDYDLSRPFPGAPDLAVEVMSPGDNIEAVLTRVRKYLQSGTEQVWVVFPRQQEVHQYHRADAENVRVYTGTQAIDAGELLPGLVLEAAECFTLPTFE
jgi:Uma2 family endonuclease